MTKTIELPEPAAHMYPSDLEKFKSTDTFAQAYSVAVGNPDERSVPLFTLSDMVAYAEACARAGTLMPLIGSAGAGEQRADARQAARARRPFAERSGSDPRKAEVGPDDAHAGAACALDAQRVKGARRQKMARTLDMFDKPRKKREWLMHVIDCANGNCGELEDGEQVVEMECARCGHESGWISLPSLTAEKRGLPCPKCNTVPNLELRGQASPAGEAPSRTEG